MWWSPLHVLMRVYSDWKKTTGLISFKHVLFMVNDSEWEANSSAAVLNASSVMPVTLVELITVKKVCLWSVCKIYVTCPSCLSLNSTFLRLSVPWTCVLHFDPQTGPVSFRSIHGNPLTHENRHSLWMKLQRIHLCYTAYKTRFCEICQMSH